MPTSIIDINAQNINETLQASQNIPLVLVFFAPSMPESQAFTDELIKIAQQSQGQFLLGKVNCEVEQQLAAQFQLQTLPTTYLFKEGKAVGAIPGVVDDATLQQHLALILPSEEDIAFNQALEALANGKPDEALPFLKSAWELSNKKNSEIALLYAETYLAMKRIEPAQEILNQVPLQDQNSEWQSLQAKIDLLLKAADSPEIQQLQEEYKNKETPQIALKLAVALHQAGRSEEALKLLLPILQQDLNAEGGEVKKEFLDILAALGNSDPLTTKYRRQLYSLLY